jgi:uracil-DNA glycosylase
MGDFCPGYVQEPFKTLAADYPDETAYPFADFRVEWGPIFHRGRLDGSARVLCIGQDPGQHENILRRILVGEAGRRVQGFLAKLGITRSYVMINALLYSVFGSNGSKHVAKPALRDYRNEWITGILKPRTVQAVVTFGGLAKTAWTEFTKVHGAPSGVAIEHLTHPTFPESAGGTKAEKAVNTKKMLRQWSGTLEHLHPAVSAKDVPMTPLVPYGDAFVDTDKVDIPSIDVPAGIPRWMYDDDGWARRIGSKVPEKRRNITLTVPDGVIP